MTSRNDPCPCGSGRKYKRCCLGKERSAPAPAPGPAYTAAERERALEKLMRFAVREEFLDDHTVAFALFWGVLDDKRDEALARVIDESRGAYLMWFAVDMNLEDGKTVLDLFLDRHMRTLSPGAAEFLRRLGDSHLRAYEVTEVRRDEGVTVLDLWTDEEVRVSERLATN